MACFDMVGRVLNYLYINVMVCDGVNVGKKGGCIGKSIGISIVYFHLATQ